MNSNSPRVRFFFARLFPVPFLLIGAVTLYFGIQGVIQAQESETWPMADGTIQNSEVAYHSSSDGGGTYHAAVFYQFIVAGKPLPGNKVAVGDYGSSNPSHAQEIVNRYPKGKTVTVYYAPGDPTNCLLEPGVHWQTWFLPGFGLIFFLVGSVMAVHLPKTMK